MIFSRPENDDRNISFTVDLITDRVAGIYSPQILFLVFFFAANRVFFSSFLPLRAHRRRRVSSGPRAYVRYIIQPRDNINKLTGLILETLRRQWIIRRCTRGSWPRLFKNLKHPECDTEPAGLRRAHCSPIGRRRTAVVNTTREYLYVRVCASSIRLLKKKYLLRNEGNR